METVRGIHTVKMFEKDEQRHSSWMTLFVDTVNAHLTTLKLTNVFDFANKLLFGIEGIVIIYLGATRVLDGVFSVGALMAFLAYKDQFENRVGDLVNNTSKSKCWGCMPSALRTLCIDRNGSGRSCRSYVPEISGDIDIAVENVSFRYSDSEPYVLQNFSGTSNRVNPQPSRAVPAAANRR